MKLRSMPTCFARSLMRFHIQVREKGSPRDVMKTFAGVFGFTNVGRPAEEKYRSNAARALLPTGTTRSLLPLPMTVMKPASS